MPYYLYPKSEPFPATDPECDCDRHTGFQMASKNWPTFPTRVDAYQAKTAGLAVGFWASAEEHVSWTDREIARFNTGEYMRVPWRSASYSYGHGPNEELHYVHLSLKDEGMIAYTPDAEYGVQDRQVRLRPGKYLEKFFSAEPKETRDKWIKRCQSFTDGVKIVTSADDICKVYAGGPSSCMSGGIGGPKATEYGWDACPVAPVAVYGDSDFALAYMGELTEATARALVRKENKTYGRCYGDIGLIQAALNRAGYQRADSHYAFAVNGKVRKVPTSNGGYLMPYVDGVRRATVDSKGDDWLILDEDGTLSTQNTCGSTREWDEDDDQRDEDDDQNCCGHCAVRCGDNDYCEDCENRRWVCDRCETSYFNDDCQYFTNAGRMLCEVCEDQESEPCANETCDEYIYSGDITQTIRLRLERDHTLGLCDDCAQSYSHCSDCDTVTLDEELKDDLCETCQPDEEDDDSRIVATDDTDTLPLPLESAPIMPASDGWRFWEAVDVPGRAFAGSVMPGPKLLIRGFQSRFLPR